MSAVMESAGLLSLVTAPTIEPLTVADAKRQIRLDDSDGDTTLDADLTAWITTARQLAEQDTGRAFLTQTWKLYLEAFPCWNSPIVVPNPPLASVTSVKYYDGDGTLQTWSSSNYRVLTPAGPTAARGEIAPVSGVSWPTVATYALSPRRTDAVQVEFVCGWTTAALVPQPIKSAMKLWIGHWFGNRESVNVGNMVTPLPDGVAALLSPFRVLVY